MSIRPLFVLAAAVCASGCAAAAASPQAAPARSYISPRTPADTGQPPFSGAVRVGDTLYLSGAIGIDANQKVPDTAEGEARAVLDSVKATLTAAGMTMDDLVSVQIFCSDVAHYAAFNNVYRTYFTKEFPARAFIGSGKLLFDARFEVQGIAVKR
jgi:2-iminobutanoate/2-iminopropanoate deaminase